jgi:hypothetical protein
VPLSEGIGGLRPSRLAARLEDQDERAAHIFLLRLIELLAGFLCISLGAVLMLLVLFVFYLNSRDARRDEVNDQLTRLTCIADRAIDPHSTLHRDLQDYLNQLDRTCQGVKLRPVLSVAPATRTRIITRRPPAAARNPQIPPAASPRASRSAETRSARTPTPPKPSQGRSGPRSTPPASRSRTPAPPRPSPTHTPSPSPSSPLIQITLPGLIKLSLL